jgi:hypothetical protein
VPFTSPAQPALDAINESMERQCYLAHEYTAALETRDRAKIA